MPGMRYQPQGRAVFDRAIPQLAGAVAIVGNADLRNGRRPSPATVDTPHGRAASLAFAGNLNVPYAALNVPTTPSWTVLMVIRKDADLQYPYFLGTSGGTAANTAIAAAQANVGKNLAIYDGSGTVRDSGLLLQVGSFYVIALTFDSEAGQFSWYADGVQRNTTPGVGIGGANWHICGTTGQQTAVTLPLLAIIPRALPASLARGLTSNPWQLFEDDDDFDFAPTPAAQYALPVGAAALAVAGGQVAMRLSRRLRAAPATLAITGGPAAMHAARRLHAQPAGLALATGQVSVRAGRRLSVQPTALEALAGQVQLSVSRRLGVQPAAMAVSGQGLAMRAGRRMQVAPAPLALVGGSVSMQYSPALVPGKYTLPVSASAMTLGGGNVGMRVSRRLPVVGAQLQLAAGAVRALIGRRLLVAGAGLEARGGSVTLRYSGAAPAFDISKIHPSRLVIFEGCGSRVTSFEGSGSRITPFDGSGSRVTPFEGSGSRITRFE